MGRREEFDKAVGVIQKALAEGIVTMSLTTTPRDSDPIVREIVIDSFTRPKATYYYEKSDGYGGETTCRGTQSNFELGILEESDKTRRQLAEKKSEYEKAMKEAASANKSFEASQKKLNDLQAEILRLEGKA